jgi:hypothetical protein
MGLTNIEMPRYYKRNSEPVIIEGQQVNVAPARALPVGIVMCRRPHYGHH